MTDNPTIYLNQKYGVRMVLYEDYEALRARLVEVERALAHDREQWNLACSDAEEAREQLTLARQELAAVLEGQEILKRQTVRIREALGAEPGEDTEEAARRVRQELAGAQDVLREAAKAFNSSKIWRGMSWELHPIPAVHYSKAREAVNKYWAEEQRKADAIPKGER